MTGWNDLPKELKWMIFKYLLYECFTQPKKYSGADKAKLGACSFYKKIYEEQEKTTIVPRDMFIYQLFILLAQIDKNSRKILQMHCIFSKTTFAIKI